MTRPLRWLMVAAALALLALGARAALRHTLGMPLTRVDLDVTVAIPPRATLSQAAVLLDQQGVIKWPRLFAWWVHHLGADTKVRYGEYRFRGAQSYRSVIETLMSGRVVLHPVTFPEGFTLKKIAARLEYEGLASAVEILKAARNRNFLAAHGLPGENAEGFLYPDTYQFPRDWAAAKILDAMAHRFWEVYNVELRKKAMELGMTTLETVTLASIIQMETGRQDELTRISAVFHNRLKKNIQLMADPAVIYGVEDFKGNLTRRHLETPGPYNVYLNKGLPPGPICNPGLPALRAALYPEKSDYLYFVARRDGTSQFSRTLAEHNKAVNLYQRGRN